VNVPRDAGLQLHARARCERDSWARAVEGNFALPVFRDQAVSSRLCCGSDIWCPVCYQSRKSLPGDTVPERARWQPVIFCVLSVSEYVGVGRAPRLANPFPPRRAGMERSDRVLQRARQRFAYGSYKCLVCPIFNLVCTVVRLVGLAGLVSYGMGAQSHASVQHSQRKK
jgi:hypothetical protein